MEPSAETGSFVKGLIFLSAFTTFMVFIVYLFMKLISSGAKSEENESEKGAGKEQGHVSRGSITEVKGGKKKKVKGQRDRTSSKAEEHTDSEWLQTTLKGHSAEVVAMTFSPNFKYLATIGNDRVVFLWHTKNFSTRDHTQYRVNLGFDPANAVCFSPDSRAFMVSKTDRTVEVYKLAKKENTAEGSSRVQLAVKVNTEHKTPIVGIGIHPKFMMSCEEGSRLCFWTFKGALIERFANYSDGKTNSAKLSPCGRFLAVAGKFLDSVNLFKFDVAQDLEAPGAKILTGKKAIWTCKGSEVVAFDWSSDSSKIVALGPQNGEFVWKLFDIQGLRPAEICTGSVPQADHSDESSAPPTIHLSADGFLLLIGSGEDVFIFSILMGGLPFGSVQVHSEAPVRDVAFGEGDKQFLTCGDRTIRIFNNVPGKRELLRHMEKQVGEKATGTAMRTRLKAEIIALEEELRPFEAIQAQKSASLS